MTTAILGEFQNQLKEKAVRDASFRDALLRNPKQVIEDEFGVRMPKDIEINIVEETPTTLYIVLPSIVASDDQESYEYFDRLSKYFEPADGSGTHGTKPHGVCTISRCCNTKSDCDD